MRFQTITVLEYRCTGVLQSTAVVRKSRLQITNSVIYKNAGVDLEYIVGHPMEASVLRERREWNKTLSSSSFTVPLPYGNSSTPSNGIQHVRVLVLEYCVLWSTGVQCTGVPRCAISVRSPAFYADGGCVCVQIFRNTEMRLSLLILCFFTSELVATTDSEPDL